MRVLFVTAVPAEANAIRAAAESASVIAGGIGRTNAAAATTEAILEDHADAVINVGLAGALPGGGHAIGEAVLASSCIYCEEGMIGPNGFTGMAGLGFTLGDFPGNEVPVDDRLLEVLGDAFAIGPIATVATCSGTDAAAAEVVRRTGAVAEAMEGAAVVHAARRLAKPAIELRVISNTTGNRDRQQWDMEKALQELGKATARALRMLEESDIAT